MNRILLAVLLPALCIAQYTFGPTRLDDGLDNSFFYPVLSPRADGSLFCTWASLSEARIGTYGQFITPAGEFAGARIPYQEVEPGHNGIVCPAKLRVLPLANGGEGRLIFHS
jgi:hypothetical protein